MCIGSAPQQTKTNYHIHLIFSERKLLPEPDIKIATRSVFYDETGKRVRTKKEITDENGQIRKGCTVIKKGDVYESHLFKTKDERFKSEAFIAEAKEVYTELINSHISDPEQRLKVFDKNSVYLPTKKIGKNNPKAAEIEADNTARQEWNRTADLALVSGIEETKILEIKQTEIHDKAGQSIRENGWLPNLFRSIVGKAKEFLQAIIREKDMPPKPVLDMDMDEFRTMQTLMLKVQKQAKAIKKIQEITLPNLRQQLAETTGIFKGKERKALEKQIQQTESELKEKLDKLPDILKDDGYPDVQAFMKTYRKAEAIITQYNQDLAEWEQTVKNGQKPAEKQHRPPERQSVRNRLRQLQEESKQSSQSKQRKKSQAGTDNHDIGNQHRRATCLAVLHIYQSIRKHPARFFSSCRVFSYAIQTQQKPESFLRIAFLFWVEFVNETNSSISKQVRPLIPHECLLLLISIP